jgi:hypothetical protein
MAPQKGKKTCFALDIFSGTFNLSCRSRKRNQKYVPFSKQKLDFFRLLLIFCHQKHGPGSGFSEHGSGTESEDWFFHGAIYKHVRMHR